MTQPKGRDRPPRRIVQLLLGASGVLVLALVVAPAVLVFLTDEATVRSVVAEAGIWAPALYILLQAAQIVFAPIPGQFITLAAGHIFGPIWGFFYSLIGTALGASAAFWLARLFGRSVVEFLVGADQLAQWERRWRPDRPILWFAILLLPVPDVVFYLAGLTGIPWRSFLVAVLLGRAPGLFLTTAFGYVLGELPWWILILAAAVGLGGYWLFQKPLAKYRRRFLRRWVRAVGRNRAKPQGPSGSR
ncbi:MAG: hypothetical protein C4315_07245 [Chloroflexota bacterium]